MKFLNTLIFIGLTAFIAWPYIHIFQISSAVMNNNRLAIEKLVDFESVNKIHKKNIEWKANNMVEINGSILPESMRGGAEAIAGALGNLAAETTTVDASWVMEQLRIMEGSPWEQMTFAIFESPTSFIIRLGNLGRNTIHIRMTLLDWKWRVTAIYG
ncbi:MAG: DUF2939 domain-containing protein [Candidatus Marithrix sp.]|nr:DUF2939 domain-containing protein [Candidatus Marithrix sp.]